MKKKQPRPRFAVNNTIDLIRAHLKIVILAIFLLMVIGGTFLWKSFSSHSSGVQPSSSQSHKDAILKQANSFVTQCESSNDWRDCYGNLFFSYDRSTTLTDTLQVLDAVENIDLKTRDCHILAHKMMQAEIQKDPSKWEQLLKKVSYTSCNYGFIHGIMEGRGYYDKTFQVNATTIPQICDIMKKDNPSQGVDATCSHIFGHLLLAYNYSNTILSSITTAVGVCDKLPQAMRHECYAGIFMESFTRDNLVNHGLAQYIPWNKTTIAAQENICLQFSAPTSWGCWQEISHMYNSEYPNSPITVAKMCARAPTSADRYYCYMHAVATLVNNRNGSHGYFATICRPFIKNLKSFDQCSSVAIHSLLQASIKNTDRAFYYCSSFSNIMEQVCYSQISLTLHQTVSLAEQTHLCQGAPKKFRVLCRGKV